MSATLPIGIDDFRALREQGLTYVDKTHLVCELIDRPGAPVVFLPRPRRFGKSLALSMLRCFFDRQGADCGHLFEGLAVWRAGDRYRGHFRRYPVIHLGFHDLDGARWDDVQWAACEKLRDLVDEHRAVLDAGAPGAPGALARERLGRLLDGSAPLGLYQRVLLDLTRALHRAHGEKVVLLIDDCDLPAHAGHAHGYGREAEDFFGGLLATGLHGNPHLARAVLTGVGGAVRPGNVAVYTLLRDEFATCFGFTDSEVDALLAHAAGERDVRELRAVIDRWYGGHRSGRHTVYNPWSVLSFLADSRARPRPYWLLAGGRDPVRQVLARAHARVRALLGPLLAGADVTCALDDSVLLDRLAHGHEALCSLLVLGGWLRAVERSPGDTPEHALAIPNHEVDTLLRGLLAEQRSAAPEPPGPATPPPRVDRVDREDREDHESRAARASREDHEARDQREAAGDDLLGPAGGLLQRHAGRVRDRDQDRSPRERRPDILADAAAFEERLQSFLDEMRAGADTPSGIPPAVTDDGDAGARDADGPAESS
jgi:hypothetical protein